MSKFATMGKEALRAACREVGISYGKLNNDGMRAALSLREGEHQNQVEDDGAELPLSTAGAGVFANMVTPPAAPKVAVTVGRDATVVRDGKKVDPNAPTQDDEDDEAAEPYHHDGSCPLCKAPSGDQTAANEGVTNLCHHCGKTYSLKTGREVRAGHTRENVNSGYKIEKERATQNGVTRPSTGTLCGNVWDALDKLRNETGMATAADLPVLAASNGWNKNNVMCEFYTWRKFNGISGRQTRPASTTTDTGESKV